MWAFHITVGFSAVDIFLCVIIGNLLKMENGKLTLSLAVWPADKCVGAVFMFVTAPDQCKCMVRTRPFEIRVLMYC